MTRLRLLQSRHRRLLRAAGQVVALTTLDIVEVRQRIGQGETAQSLAVEFGVTRKRIVRAVWNTALTSHDSHQHHSEAHGQAVSARRRASHHRPARASRRTPATAAS